MIFCSKLLSSFSLSATYSLLKHLHYTGRERQAVVTVKIYNPGLDRIGVTHFFTLCDPCLGPDPYFGKHCHRIPTKVIRSTLYDARV